MILKTLAEFDATFSGGAHQMNPAAGRFGLQPKRTVGRTLIQTQSAMDALIESGRSKVAILG